MSVRPGKQACRTCVSEASGCCGWLHQPCLAEWPALMNTGATTAGLSSVRRSLWRPMSDDRRHFAPILIRSNKVQPLFA